MELANQLKMYAKGKGAQVPSDAQAREKLALYVYEYLLHVGAQKAAQTFLSEVSTSMKNTRHLQITLTDSVGKEYNSWRTSWIFTLLVVVSYSK